MVPREHAEKEKLLRRTKPMGPSGFIQGIAYVGTSLTCSHALRANGFEKDFPAAMGIKSLLLSKPGERHRDFLLEI
jgi:hypothetical protein